jgi:MYXO-CTERM domain-containing protein
VAGPIAPLPLGDAAAEAPVRVAVAPAQSGLEPRFAVSSVPQPDKWMLVLAGLALAGWVAHRRLSNTL